MIELNQSITAKQFVEFSDKLDELRAHKYNSVRANYESVKLAIECGLLVGGSCVDVENMSPKEAMSIARKLSDYYIEQVTVTEEKAKN